ncbi:MAG TPA: hypothetical protein VET48_12335, partial [Steroidobacteraceae bacterium]|nr:hypothetical protein [Steroidobacteraceae bacterium]
FAIPDAFEPGITGAVANSLIANAFASSGTRNITSYGIKCDGMTDNTVAFAAMEARAPVDEILATPTNGVCVGKYVIMRAHRSLFLSAGSSIKCPSSSVCDAITVNAAYVTINGLGTVDGNRANVTSSIGIQVNGGLGASHITIRGIAIAHAGNDGLFDGYGIRALDVPYLDVENIHVTDTGGIGVFTNIKGNADVPGLRLRGIQCDRTAEGIRAMAGCIFAYNNSDHGIGSNFYTNAVIAGNSVRCPIGQTGNYVCLTAQGLKNSIYRDNTTSGSQLGHSIVSSDNVQISNNTAHAFTYYGLELSRVTHSTARGTRCDGSNVGIAGQHCVVLDGSTSHVTIDDTRAMNILSDVIMAMPSRGPATLTDITINGTVGTAPRGKSCVYLQNIRNFSVSGGDCDGAHLGGNYGVRLIDSFPGRISQFSGHDLERGVAITGSNGAMIDNIAVGPDNFVNVSQPVSAAYVGGATCGAHITVNEPVAANGKAMSYSDFCHRIAPAPGK